MSEQLKHIPEDVEARLPNTDAPELHAVEQGEQTVEERELVERISQIKGLPHEHRTNPDFVLHMLGRQHNKATDWAGEDENVIARSKPEGKESLKAKETRELLVFLMNESFEAGEFAVETMNDQEIKDMIQSVVAGNNLDAHPHMIARFGSWLASHNTDECHDLIVKTERQVAIALKKNGTINFSTAVFLGEIKQHKVAGFIEDELSGVLETNVSLAWGLQDQMAVLNRLNNATGNVIFHKIIDFFQEHLETLQDHDVKQKSGETLRHEDGDQLNSSSRDFDEFVKKEIAHSTNYLIQRHLQDYFESVFQYDADKPGTVHGSAGGSSDETIYTFRNLRNSYTNHLALGIKEGYPIANPVLPIAPGYYGYYQTGKLAKIFSGPEADGNKARLIEEGFIKNNHPEDEYIYDELNKPLLLARNEDHPSNKLKRLRDIWDFKKHLRATGRKFFFDTARLRNIEDLHPMVLGDLLTENQLYIQKNAGQKNDASPIDIVKFQNVVFPYEKSTREKEYSYRYLMSLSMRKKVEDDFSIDLSELPIASQAQFLDFLVKKDVKDFNRIKKTIAGYQGDKLAVIESFFACAENEDYGDIILGLVQSLKDKPGAAQKLFTTYADFTEKLNSQVEGISTIYNFVFTSSEVSRESIFYTLTTRVNELLAKTYEQIKSGQVVDLETTTQNLINNFKSERQAVEKHYQALETIAQTVRQRLGEVVGMIDGIPLSLDSRELLIDPETTTHNITQGFNDLAARAGHPELAMAPSPEMPEHNLSHRLELAIQSLRQDIDGFADYHEWVKNNYDSQHGPFPGTDESYSENLKKQFENKWKPILTKAVNSLRELLKFQKAFEQKFQQLIVGEKEIRLPGELLSRLPAEVNELAPERLPAQEPLYFPVGISKEMLEWKKVLSGEAKAAKPIDVYGYLFWLNNQGKKAQLVVCDEIQTVNYENLYGVSEGEARQTARTIGARERANYQAIVDTFALSNIEVVDYQSFKNEHAAGIERYQELCGQLAEHPVFQEAFFAMVQESVAGASAEDKAKHLQYAQEELVWILAANGTKVSHRNEARYDALAAFIKTAENLSSLNQEDFLDLVKKRNVDKLAPILNGAMLRCKNSIDGQKQHNQPKSEAAGYWDNLQASLKTVENNLKKWRGPVQEMPEKFAKSLKAEFNFVSPNTSSQSFGWRSRGEKDETVMKFREPYSTYFYTDGAEVFLNSEQVVAVPDGLIAGKILAMDKGAQEKYAAMVIKPLLLQYFKSLEVAPRRYFDQVGKTAQELMQECRDARTILDLLHFVQRYVVAPAAQPRPVEAGIAERAKTAAES